MVLEEVGRRIDRAGGPPLYRQVRVLLEDQMRAGAIAPGDALPPQRELSALWSIGEVTVRRALQQLAAEGLLEAHPGSGTLIRDPGWPAAAAGGGGGRGARPLSVGVALADLADGYPFFHPVLQGLRCGERPAAVRLFEMPLGEPGGGSLQHLPHLAQLDALVMMSPVNLGLLAACQARRLPVVLLFSDLADGCSRCISPDYTRGVVEAVDHLVRRRKRRVALVTAGPERFSTGRWIEAYRAALRAFHLPSDPAWLIQAGYHEADGAAALRELMALKPRPDAVVLASDFMARGALLAAHELGLRVPRAVAVIGAGPVLDERGWTVPLTSIDLGLYDLGRLARQAIDAALDGRADAPLRQSVSTRLREGKTA
jgi:LacI family transcriptional regulator